MNTLIDSIKNLSAPFEPVPTGATLKLNPLDGIETVLFSIYGTLLISNSGDVSTATAVASAEALTQSLIVSGYEGDPERAGELGPELLHTEIKHWHEASRENGTDFPEVEISRVWKKVIKRFQALKILKSDDDPQRIERLAVEYECRINPVWPMPDARRTLENLRDRGFRLGIVSNAQFYTPLTIEALFGKPLEALGFEKELCVFSYKELCAKPSVELFKALPAMPARRNLSTSIALATEVNEGESSDEGSDEEIEREKLIDLSKTLYVGNDMLDDIWTASQAGCKTALFAGDWRSLRERKEDKRCKKLAPDAIVDHLHQITEII